MELILPGDVFFTPDLVSEMARVECVHDPRYVIKNNETINNCDLIKYMVA